MPTHWVPATGLEARSTPDAALAPVARLDPWLEVAVAQTWGEWAQVVCANGWWGWVDGRVLVPRAAGAPTGAATAVPTTTGATAAFPPADTSPSGATFAQRAVAGWPALVGAALLAVAAVLPWLEASGRSIDSFDVPLEFLLSYDSTTDLGVDLGVLVVVLALVGAVAVVLTPQALWRRSIGTVAVAVALLYAFQLNRLLSQAPASDRPSLLSSLGYGVFVAIVGGGALGWAPDWPWGRARS